MKTVIAGLLLAAVVLATSGCGTDITGTCIVQRRALGGYGVVLDRQGAATGGANCDTVLPARLGDTWTFDKNGPDQTDLVMRPLSLTARVVDTASGDQAFLTESLDADHPDLANGTIGLTPDATGTCDVASMTTVRQDVVFLNEDSSTEPPTDTPEPPNPRSIAITSLKFLSAPQYQGSQLEVAATYTNGDCSASYTGIGLTPLVQCESDDNCNPFADPAAGRSTGSGINPAYPVSCSNEVAQLFPVQFEAGTGGITVGSENASGVCWLTGTTFPVLK